MIRYNKKADTDVSMAWIFMTIVGVVFILLAYNIVQKYQENENNKYELELKQSLRSILNNAGRTTGVEESALQNAGKMFASKTVEVKCIADIPTLWIDNGKISDTQNDFLKNYPFFMTNIGDSKTDDVYIAVENFRIPFKTTNMIAVLSRKNLIVFDKNSQITKKFLYKFNKGSYKNLNYIADFDMTSDFQSVIDYAEDRNLDSVVIVSDRKPSNPITQTKLSQLKINAYLVEIEEMDNGNYGTIYYLDQNGDTSNYNYIDYDKSLGLITMATFSNPQTFNCSYNMILNSSVEVYDYYIMKTTYMYNISKTELICSSSLLSYDTSGNATGDIQQYHYQNLNESLTDSKVSIITNKLTALTYAKLIELDGKFKELEKYNCPYVY